MFSNYVIQIQEKSRWCSTGRKWRGTRSGLLCRCRPWTVSLCERWVHCRHPRPGPRLSSTSVVPVRSPSQTQSETRRRRRNSLSCKCRPASSPRFPEIWTNNFYHVTNMWQCWNPRNDKRQNEMGIPRWLKAQLGFCASFRIPNVLRGYWDAFFENGTVRAVSLSKSSNDYFMTIV